MKSADTTHVYMQSHLLKYFLDTYYVYWGINMLSKWITTNVMSDQNGIDNSNKKNLILNSLCVVSLTTTNKKQDTDCIQNMPGF